MGELDQYTIKHEPISSTDLMERAATALAREIQRRFSVAVPIMAFAGPGNNGGDTLAVARLLSQAGYHLSCYLFNINGRLSEDCMYQKQRLQAETSVSFIEVTSQFEAPQLTSDHVVIDGLFGTGLSKPLNGGFASLVKFINASPATIVSVDIPSGLMCEDNAYNVRAHIVRAHLTLTFQLPKLSLILPDTQGFVGELKVLPIGLHPDGIARIDTPYAIMEPRQLQTILKPRDPFGHKGTFGKALLVAGAYGMAGAAVLAAKACLRSGVGKVVVHTPDKNNNILQVAVPEAVLSADAGTDVLTKALPADPFNAVAIGPGIGTEHCTALAFIEQVRHTRVPLVIDADGLNILADHKGWMQQVPAGSILTPHPLEMRRLGNRSIDSWSTLHEALEMAVRHQCYFILKGHYTAICTPQGKVWFNPTGNSGMATAGSGDVLTGILLALLAQRYTAEQACQLAVYIHGLAGDIAADKWGEISLTASDLVACLPRAFRALSSDADLPCPSAPFLA